MRTIDELSEEHRWIGRMLDCLERLALEAREGRFRAEEAAELLFLFETFADGQHQEKEEAVLLPFLVDRASARDEQDLSELLVEHVREREAIGRLRSDLGAALRVEAVGAAPFARDALDYVRQHRAHMAHEDRTLPALAERLLTPDDDALLSQAFRAVEVSGHDRTGVFERVRALCRRLRVPTGEHDGDAGPGS